MDKYTIELTYEELRLVARALVTEEDRLDAIKSDKLKDIEPLEDRIHTIYGCKTSQRERTCMD